MILYSQKEKKSSNSPASERERSEKNMRIRINEKRTIFYPLPLSFFPTSPCVPSVRTYFLPLGKSNLEKKCLTTHLRSCPSFVVQIVEEVRKKNNNINNQSVQEKKKQRKKKATIQT